MTTFLASSKATYQKSSSTNAKFGPNMGTMQPNTARIDTRYQAPVQAGGKAKAKAIMMSRDKTQEKLKWLVLSFIFLLTVLVFAGFSTFRVYAQENGEVYEIIRSTEDRIWRLNKQTGEVSVCTLAGDNLVCTNTEDAAVPPSKTYEDIKEEEAAAEAEREAEIAAAEAERKAEQRAEQERQLSIMDRILDMFRELMHMSMEEPSSTSD
jgi:hypothetical protein